MGLWTGNYSRSTFSEQKEYLFPLTQQGIPWVDSDDNEGKWSSMTQIRRVQQLLGDGTRSDNNGFLCVGTGASNDFTIKGGGTLGVTGENAGRLFVKGIPCTIYFDTNYMNSGATLSDQSIFSRITAVSFNSTLTQTTITDSAANWIVNEFQSTPAHYICPDVTKSTTYAIVSNTSNTITVAGDVTQYATVGAHYRINLFTPIGGNRTDYVYLNVYIDEYDSKDDPNILQPLIVPTETDRRAKVIHSVVIREGADTVTDYVDSDGNQHWIIKIAQISRYTSQNPIYAIDIKDLRPLFFPYPILSLRQVYGVDTWSATHANHYSIYPSPGFTDISQITAGVIVSFKAGSANTGACDILVSGFGSPFPITKNGGLPLDAGDISLHEVVTAVFDGTNMEINSSQVGEWIYKSGVPSLSYASGFVGIGGTFVGATEPTELLHVSSTNSTALVETTGTSHPAELLLETNSSSGSAVIGLENVAGASLVSLSKPYSMVLSNASTHAIHMATNGAIRATLDGTGYFGIGTLTPAVPFEVASGSSGSSVELARFDDAACTGLAFLTVGVNTTTGGFFGWDFANSVLAINAHSSGGSAGGLSVKNRDSTHSNFGIWQTSPTWPLHITSGVGSVLLDYTTSGPTSYWAASIGFSRSLPNYHGDLVITSSNTVYNDGRILFNTGGVTNFSMDVSGNLSASNNITSDSGNFHAPNDGGLWVKDTGGTYRIVATLDGTLPTNIVRIGNVNSPYNPLVLHSNGTLSHSVNGGAGVTIPTILGSSNKIAGGTQGPDSPGGVFFTVATGLTGGVVSATAISTNNTIIVCIQSINSPAGTVVFETSATTSIYWTAIGT